MRRARSRSPIDWANNTPFDTEPRPQPTPDHCLKVATMATPRGGRKGGDRKGGGHGGNANSGRGRNNAQSDERPTQGVYTPRNSKRQGRQSGGSSNARDSPSNSTVSVAADVDSPAPNFAPHEYQKRLQYPCDDESMLMRAQIKAQRPKIRAKFVKDRLMNPDGQMRLQDSVKLYGLCKEMCPEYERVRRIVELDVKAPECTPETQHLRARSQRIPDESRMVKAYARSAAGMDVELVSEIRTPDTCLRTLKYLYGRLDEDDFQFLHSWLWDRTRAVRKDLRTQRIENRHDIAILLTSLEYSARFYMLSAHHMARSTKDDYSHQQDVEQLNQTLISLKERYVDNRRAGIVSANEAEFWAYRLILAPIYANTALENELHGLPNDLKHNPRIQAALEIFRLLKSIIIHRNAKNYIQCQSNWKKFWDFIKSPRVSYLMACAAAISFNRIRHVALDAVWRVYRLGLYRHQQDVTDWTPGKLREVLGMDTDSEAVKFCEAHGFVFAVDEAGATYMDIKQKAYERKKHVLGKADVKPQFFSASIVEPKRCGRPLSAVIAGMTVREATGGVMPSINKPDETSLFVPETSNIFSQQTTRTNPFTGGLGSGFDKKTSPFQLTKTPTENKNPFGQGIQPGIFDASKNDIKFAPSTNTNVNPFAKFQSTSTEPNVNPFLKNSNTAQSQSTPVASLVNPFEKNVFAQPQSTAPASGVNVFLRNNSAVPTQPTAPAPAGNFFLQNSSAAPTQSTNPAPAGNFFLQNSSATPTQSANPAPASNFFLQNSSAAPTQSTNPATSGSPFSFGAFSNSSSTPQAQLPGANLEVHAATPTLNPTSTFMLSGSTSNAAPSQATSQSGFSFTPSTTPPQDTSTQDVSGQKTEDGKREAEKQRLEDEARQRVQAAQREKKAKEEEQRRAAAAARQRQEQADRERKAREEQEELVRQARQQQERQRQAQEEQAQKAREREKDAALSALTEDLVLDKKEGLVWQYIENVVDIMTEDVARGLEMKEREASVDRKYESYLKDLKRAALAKIMMAAQKKKKLEKARERRKRWKQQRTRALTMEEEVDNAPALAQSPATPQSDGHSAPQQSVAPPNSRRAKRTEQRHKTQASEKNGDTDKGATLGNSGLRAEKTTPESPVGNTPAPGYSQAYLKAIEYAPVDRTETDWFRLRARGIDPSKYRKRSFDYTSSDEEKPKLSEPKRPKLAASPSVAEDQVSTPPKTLEEVQWARADAVHQSFRRSRSGTSPSSSFTEAFSAQAPSSFGDSTSLIERARRCLAESKSAMPPPSYTNGSVSLYRSGPFDRHASPLIARAKGSVQHDWSRSVPNLGFSASFSNSIGPTASTKDRPAYWDRPSRFVPQHLYGKGAEAVRAWRVEQGLSKSSASTRPPSTEPFATSSPITTYEAYAQPQLGQMGGYLSSPTNTFDSYSQMQPAQAPSYTTDPYTNPSEVSGVQIIGVDAKDSKPVMNSNEMQQYDQDLNFYTNPEYASQHQQSYDQDAEDADSEMLDEDEALDYNSMEDAGSDDEEVDDSVEESYDEDEEDDDDDATEEATEEDEDDAIGNTPNDMRPGATEDDAIELSD
ncbi:80 kD MCM3-associated [Pyrenophora seminiperda CCB06]|uniref:80 kD MCM3-associated n=1 Tax=Pyrenophora seminiperda CCB06 TaxID=1302712 RepID=A0A3M7MFT2_9PLEO|nr:80 kD MCM3-associated [Pyrenophora seminiperda CCB06]